jgi:hypothetical protein
MRRWRRPLTRQTQNKLYATRSTQIQHNTSLRLATHIMLFEIDGFPNINFTDMQAFGVIQKENVTKK